jgi:hypothetical protein
MKDEDWIQAVIGRVHDKGDVARNGRDPERDHSLHTKSGEDQKRSKISAASTQALVPHMKAAAQSIPRLPALFDQTASKIADT